MIHLTSRPGRSNPERLGPCFLNPFSSYRRICCLAFMHCKFQMLRRRLCFMHKLHGDIVSIRSRKHQYNRRANIICLKCHAYNNKILCSPFNKCWYLRLSYSNGKCCTYVQRSKSCVNSLLNILTRKCSNKKMYVIELLFYFILLIL